MKRKLLSAIAILVIAVLSACGPEPTPTLSVVEAQSTAFAAAFAALTQTQAAIPTATQTPIPPTPTMTFTPPPTFTPFPTMVPATLPDTSAIDPCNEPPPVEPKGEVVRVKFVNRSDGSINLAFGKTKENDYKECGTYSYSIERYQDVDATVLAGCYWGYAWVFTNPSSTAQTPELICMTDTSVLTTVWINAEVISVH